MTDLQNASDAFGAAFADPAPIALSPSVAAFLLQILNSIQLPVAADNFEEQAAMIVEAKRELSG